MRLSIVSVVLVIGCALALATPPPHSPPPHGDPPGHAPGASGVTALSPESRQLFRLEMAGLQGAMLDLVPALVAGEGDRVAVMGERIRDGFVLARELSAEQRAELHRVLPAEFLERDRAFHDLAGGLVAAARERRQDVVTFYVYKLAESCVECHSRHARERFPAFSNVAPGAAPHDH